MLRELKATKWTDYREALIESFSVITISFLPIFFAIFSDFLEPNGDFALTKSLMGLLKGGELFIYVASILAPLFYILLKHRLGNQRFPALFFFMFVYSAIYLVSVASFAIIRTGHYDPNALFQVSIVLLAVGFIINYFVLLFNNSLASAPDLRKEEEDFQKRLIKHREIQ